MANSKFIPDDIIGDILSRLPSNSLLRFKSVSKSWYSLISHPNFIGLQFKRASLNPRILFVLEQQFQLLDPECLSFNESCLSAPFNFPSETPPEKNSFTYLGSSCGLVCVSKFSHQSRTCGFFLWNPFTREIREIPFIPHMNSATCDHFYDESVHGLGYDPVSNDLKLVLWNWVFSMNLNSWKSIEFPASLGSNQHATHEDLKATVLNGVFHWLKKSYSYGSVEIIAFDSTSDQFLNLQIPQIASSPLQDANLFEHGGCLCIFFSLLDSNNVMEIRMWKDHAWILFLKLQIPQVPPTPFCSFPGETFFFPTYISKRSGRVILHNWKHLLRSKKEDETCEEIFNRLGFVCDAFTCAETLISPNRIICFNRRNGSSKDDGI